MGLKFKTVTARQLAEAFDGASKEARDGAMEVLGIETNLIKDKSIKNSPVDTGELEAAHKVTKRANGSDKVTYDVTVGGVVNGVNVDDYAMKIHEGIGWEKLGEKSLAKQAGQTEIVGEKFLERAYDSRIETTIKNIYEALQRKVAKYVG